jgi:hypothetical protein
MMAANLQNACLPVLSFDHLPKVNGTESLRRGCLQGLVYFEACAMRRSLMLAGAGLTLGVCAGLLLRRRRADLLPAETPPMQLIDTRAVTRAGLLYVVVPVWLTAGFADYLCHRAMRIERNAGFKETLLHLLQLAELGLPCLAVLFVEITAPVLGLIFLALMAHEATALWDVRYALSRRHVPPIEQHVHSFLEVVPMAAFAFISALHWPKFLALLGLRRETDRWFRWKREPLSAGTVLTVLSSVAAFELLPFAEEVWRDLRETRALVPAAPAASQRVASRERARSLTP